MGKETKEGKIMDGMRLYGIERTFDGSIKIISEEVEKETPKTYYLKKRIDTKSYRQMIRKDDMRELHFTPQTAIEEHIKHCLRS